MNLSEMSFYEILLIILGVNFFILTIIVFVQSNKIKSLTREMNNLSVRTYRNEEVMDKYDKRTTSIEKTLLYQEMKMHKLENKKNA